MHYVAAPKWVDRPKLGLSAAWTAPSLENDHAAGLHGIMLCFPLSAMLLPAGIARDVSVPHAFYADRFETTGARDYAIPWISDGITIALV
jgi:hypothetical protein